jgi:hypothetical protein
MATMGQVGRRTLGGDLEQLAGVERGRRVFERWNKWRAYGAYPDGDMLPLGRIGIRAERGDPRMTAFTKDEQYTLMTLWTIFKSPLMFGGNFPDNDEFTLSLLTNKNVLKVLNESINNKPLFRDGNKAAWIADEPGTGAKYLAVFNTQDQDMTVEDKAVWNSGLITRETPGYSKQADVDITGAKKLYLVVTDGGNGTDWDHGDWISPTLYNGKDSLKLTGLKWVKQTCGWGKSTINKGVSGSDLIINKVKYENGIGTHSNSVIEYDIPEGYTRFKALVGLDQACVVQNVGASVKFLVFTENPSGPAPPVKTKIAVNLKDLGFGSTCLITDLWSGKTVGKFSGEFAPEINLHGAGLYKITKASK